MKKKDNPDYRHSIINISSRSNKSIKEFRSLLTGRGIRRHKKALVSGEKVITELMRLQPEIIQGWISLPDENLLSFELPYHIPWYRVNREIFRELDVHGTGYPLLVVKVPEFIPFQKGKISN